MNIEEIKKWWSHPNVSGNFAIVIANRIDFLLSECDRLTTKAAQHLADQDYMVAKERKRVAGEIAEMAYQMECDCCAPGDPCPDHDIEECMLRNIAHCIIKRIRAKYGVEE